MTLIGVVAAIADPLRDAGIAIFAISSFDTDYVLVHEPDFDAAVESADGRRPRDRVGQGAPEPRIGRQAGRRATVPPTTYASGER